MIGEWFTHPSNKAEHPNCTLEKRSQAMLLHADMPMELWAEAMAPAVTVRNLSPVKGC